MPITDITSDWGIKPRIIRIVTTDNLVAITTSGYLTAQDENIQLLQNGEFEWENTDGVYIFYADGQGFFTRNATEQRFDQQIPETSVVIGLRVFTSSGTYIPNPDMNFCLIEALGGGGGGGSTGFAAAGTGWAGGGGGSGGYGRGLYSAEQIADSQIITIGAGGSTVSGSPGNPGGTTTVGSLLTVNGGQGGGAMVSAIAGWGNAVGGAGATPGSGGSVNGAGAPGSYAIVFGATTSISGTGGSTRLGGGGLALVVTGTNQSGNAAPANTGAGGSGSAIQGVIGALTNGGTGGSGIVIITEYI